MGTIRKLTAAADPITERALLHRINRLLRPRGELVKRTRSNGRAAAEFGEYDCIDISRNIITGVHVDLEEWGRDLGAPRPWETVKVSSSTRPRGRASCHAAPCFVAKTGAHRT